MQPLFASTCAAGAVLLLPAPCCSGISCPSLAVDIMLNSFPSKRVSVSKSAHVQPYVSSAALDHSSAGVVTAALELHSLSDGVFVVQQRAPLFEGCAAPFLDSLLLWIQSQSLTKVIFIAEAPAHRRVDAYLSKGPVFALDNQAAAASPSAHPVSQQAGCRALGDNSFASALVARLAAAQPSFSCIFTFASADPISSSFALAAEAARLSDLTGCPLVQPASWSRTLLPPIDQSIFG